MAGPTVATPSGLIQASGVAQAQVTPVEISHGMDDWDDGCQVSPKIWRYWQYAAIASCTGSTNASITWSSPSPWDSWNTRYAAGIASYVTNASGSSVYTTLPWRSWNQDYVQDFSVNGYGYVSPPETEAAKAVRVAREAADAEAFRKAQVERVAAEAKAKKILTEHLTKDQVHELEHLGYFHVQVGRGDRKRRYRVERKATHNVYLLDEKGKVVREFCTVLEDCPLEDQLLLQKLYLESDEKGFYEAANVWDHRGGLRDPKSLPKTDKINRLRSVLSPEEARILLPS